MAAVLIDPTTKTTTTTTTTTYPSGQKLLGNINSVTQLRIEQYSFMVLSF
jgi:hypothetical protein